MTGNKELNASAVKPYDHNLNPYSEAGISQRRHRERWDRIASAIEPMGYISLAGDQNAIKLVEKKEK